MDAALMRWCKPAVERAFHAAKGADEEEPLVPAGGTAHLEPKEFRRFLLYLQRHVELLVLFDAVDKDHDRTLSEHEFRMMAPRLAEWGVSVEDAAREFARIDANKDGKVVFDTTTTTAASFPTPASHHLPPRLGRLRRVRALGARTPSENRTRNLLILRTLPAGQDTV